MTIAHLLILSAAILVAAIMVNSPLAAEIIRMHIGTNAH